MDGAIKTENRQYVVFRLGKEEYGVETLKVISIVRMMAITRVPNTPDFIRGVINLRGEIIPVMDLRARFKLPAVEETEDTRIIIIKIDEILIGAIVDAVSEVLQFDGESIENINSISSDLSMDCIIGVGKVGDRIVTLLDFHKLVEIF